MQLAVEHCPSCGKVYQKNLRNLCHECIHKFDSALNQCIDYLRNYRKATNEELSQGTGVSVQQIVRFIKDSRISLASHPGLTYPCKACEASIRAGQMCVSCNNRIVGEWRRLVEKDMRERGTGFQIGGRFR